MLFTSPKIFRENAEGLKGLSGMIMCGDVACIQNNTIKGRLSFLELSLKLPPLLY